MNRRSFLKNSIGALLFGALSTNKVLASVVDSIPNDSLNVLLYLIQTKSGDWKVKGTKWTDIKSARLSLPIFCVANVLEQTLYELT